MKDVKMEPSKDLDRGPVDLQTVVDAGLAQFALPPNTFRVPGLPHIKAVHPPGIRTVEQAQLPTILSQALDAAEQCVRHAYVPYHRYHVGAAFTLDDERIVTGVNCDVALRGKNCAEKNALASAFEEGFEKIKGIVLTTWKNRENSNTSPICLCGTCRAQLAPFVDPDTAILMSSTDRSRMLLTSFAAIYPLEYFKPGENLDYRHYNRADFNRVSVDGLSSAQLEALDMAERIRRRAYTPFSHVASGAAVIARSGQIFTGCKVEMDSHSGGHSAESAALVKAVKSGNTVMDSIVISTDPDPETGFVPGPDGGSRQIIFEFAQVSGHDLDVIIADSSRQTIITTRASALLPCGQGPLELSSSEVALYHKVRGAVIPGYPNE